ncbi:Hypothetical protein, putative [Bodo saltans]|uniref:UTP-monosaccharide-1-phosphate uridylyltransferase n=1 Tax=Bodo saltans TaxID=75058 RepID=A0A0S4IQX2_BODSA|nr:Hypothetical protein, putative [Bodo saltans]|eukprot:CUE74260.1 Hypothetical protein, putative [Bodo saltans]
MSSIPESLISLRDTLTTKFGQQHLFPTSEHDTPQQLARLRELAAFDSSYPGGIIAYLKSAKKLLSDAKSSESLEFTSVEQPPIVIHSPSLLTPSEELQKLEEASGPVMDQSVFVLVAGGLGERLGFSGIKTSLPVETASGVSFLEHFITNFVPVFLDTPATASRIPRLVIMTSDDTHTRTLSLLQELLSKNRCCSSADHHVATSLAGIELGKDILLVKQETVPCLSDNDGHIAVDAHSGAILRKPHGHGDVHMLLHAAKVHPQNNNGGREETLLVELWRRAGIRYVCFCQDTNATSTWTLPVSLSLFQEHNLDMAFTCVPRIPKEAVGLLCHVQPASVDATSGAPQPARTVNVEYNKFDPIFRSLYGSGDVASTDPSIAPYSPFPGSINTLIVRFSPYAEILEATGGVVPEFINPKYKDANLRADFKAPTRVESLMQDVALLFDPRRHHVGGIVFERQLYHPVKNNLQEALAKFVIGGDAHCAATGEENMYVLLRQRLRSIGVQVADVAGCCLSLPSLEASRVSGAHLEVSSETLPSSASWTVSSQLVQGIADDVVVHATQHQNTNPIIIANAPSKGDLSVQLFPMISIVGGGVHQRCSLSSLKQLFPFPDRIRISGRSSLVIYAEDCCRSLLDNSNASGGASKAASSAIIIESLDLDGALTVHLSRSFPQEEVKETNSFSDKSSSPLPRAQRQFRLTSLSVRNRGWSVEQLSSNSDSATAAAEVHTMRGYKVVPLETFVVRIALKDDSSGDSGVTHQQAKM